MFSTVLYILLALLGLSFLIFIHELGHYVMARRVGMRVEVFAIGFGRPIASFIRDGVKWQIGWLPFGGYVKIAGTETDPKKDLYKIKNGFFGKSPLDRIKVAFMGPLVNLVFAFLVFSALFISGGREKEYHEFSPRIGWMDPKSELFAQGVRPGDTITFYGNKPFQSFKDHIYEPMLATPPIEVKGFHSQLSDTPQTPFDLKVQPYQHPLSLEPSVKTVGIIQPANYVFYSKISGQENPLFPGSPLEHSGIQYGDRIVWVDGVLIASNEHLNHILNDGRALLKVQRGNDVFLARAPLVLASEISPHAEFRDELIDWQYAAGFKERKLQNLYTLPYNLTFDGEVEGILPFIEEEMHEKAFPKYAFSQEEEPLQKGDRILAVGNTPIEHAYEILTLIQSPKSYIIVERNPETLKPLATTDVHHTFFKGINNQDLQKIIQGIGSEKATLSSNNLYLLNPVEPKSIQDFNISEEKRVRMAANLLEQKKRIAAIEDPKKRALLEDQLKEQQERRLLGFSSQDRKVIYNQNPFAAFASVFLEIKQTLVGLFTGSISPKLVSGPVGILQVVHDSSKSSIKEALFWLGAISLNLGVLNLMPIPVLDGGSILISLFEMVSGKRLKPQTLEKLILPFAALLMSLFIFLTYNDLIRLFKKFIP
jgi:regulator of sigma E protease